MFYIGTAVNKNRTLLLYDKSYQNEHCFKTTLAKCTIQFAINTGINLEIVLARFIYTDLSCTIQTNNGCDNQHPGVRSARKPLNSFADSRKQNCPGNSNQIIKNIEIIKFSSIPHCIPSIHKSSNILQKPTNKIYTKPSNKIVRRLLRFSFRDIYHLILYHFRLHFGNFADKKD